MEPHTTCTTNELVLYKLQQLQEDFDEHQRSESEKRDEIKRAESFNTTFRERVEGTLAFLKFINIVGIITGALLYLSKRGGIIT